MASGPEDDREKEGKEKKKCSLKAHKKNLFPESLEPNAYFVAHFI